VVPSSRCTWFCCDGLMKILEHLEKYEDCRDGHVGNCYVKLHNKVKEKSVFLLVKYLYPLHVRMSLIKTSFKLPQLSDFWATLY
jgi:hypothetical protein